MALETRYGVNVEALRSLIYTGPCNTLLWGDSTGSQQRLPSICQAICKEWKVPNGWSGCFWQINHAAGGPLVNYGGTQGEAGSWPSTGFNPDTALTGASFTVTDYYASSTYATTQVLSGVISPLPKPLKKIVKNGVWNFPILSYTYLGPMGDSQMGLCWAGGDWITDKATNALRVGVVHLANSLTVTNAMSIYTTEGQNNDAGSGGTVSNAITTTAPATAAVEVAWASLASTSVDTPFGSTSGNSGPGINQHPLYVQYADIGSLNAGKRMVSAAAIAANPTWTGDAYDVGAVGLAGNANYVGGFLIRTVYNANSTPSSSKTTFAIYGHILEDTTNTTGFYLDNISVSGDTTRTQLDGATASQMAAALTLNAQRKINCVYMHIGENETSAEWNGGSIASAVIRTNLLERIDRVRAGAALAGIPNPLIVLSSPWETVGGTKSGSAWYTTVAGIMRSIARSDKDVVFLDMRQYFADRYSTSAMFNASRTNVHMQILDDGTHLTVLGMIEYGRGSWAIITGAVDQTNSGVPNSRSDRNG